MQYVFMFFVVMLGSIGGSLVGSSAVKVYNEGNSVYFAKHDAERDTMLAACEQDLHAPESACRAAKEAEQSARLDRRLAELGRSDLSVFWEKKK